VILLLYVDDLMLAAGGSDQIDWIRNRLKQDFNMTDIGDLRSFTDLRFIETVRSVVNHQQSRYCCLSAIRPTVQVL